MVAHLVRDLEGAHQAGVHAEQREWTTERVRGEWWRDDAEAEAVRDYWAVEDEEGRRYWLFRRGDGADPATGDLGWFIHGLF